MNRRERDFKLLLNKSASPLAAMAFAFQPTTGDYWRNGVKYATLASYPGYSFTDSVDNVPNITAAGYEALTAQSSRLRIDSLPVAVANTDVVIWVVASVTPHAGTDKDVFFLGTWPNGLSVRINAANGAWINQFLATVPQGDTYIDGQISGTIRIAALFARSGGAHYFGAKAAGGAVDIASIGSPQNLSLDAPLFIGERGDGAQYLDGKVEGIYGLYATKTLAELTAILNAAV